MIHVLDSSALLAISKGERGAEFVIELINSNDCVISSVNMAEVATRLLDFGLPAHELQRAVAQFGVDVIDFNQEQSLACAALRPMTKLAGLSLGDRACLALAKLMEGVAVTADQAWQDVRISAGVEVLMIK